MSRTWGALILGLTLAFAACDGGGGGTPTAAPSPSASPTASPAPPDGLPVVPLAVGGEARLPDGVALVISTGCWQCDGPTEGLERVYRDPSGAIRVETLFSAEKVELPPRIVQTPKGPEEEVATINGFAVAPGGGRMVVSVCTRGMCLELGGSPSADARTTLFESRDGGVTWDALDDLDGSFGVEAFAGGELLLIDFGSSGGVVPVYELYPSGERLEPPAGAVAYRPLAVEDSVLWATADGRLLRSDGSEFASLPLPAGAEVVDIAVQPGADPLTAVTWYVPEADGPGSYYLAVLEGDAALRKMYSLRDLALLGGWRSPLLYGNAGVEPAELPVPPPDLYLGWLPVAFDVEEGEAAPLVDPFLERPGRNLVEAVVEGPFARVGGEGCLDVRAEPAADAEALDCAAEGVLLRDRDETRAAGGTTWLRVTTPGGTDGWADAAYLER